jgi:alcohol dehydrogenase (NADP+)
MNKSTLHPVEREKSTLSVRGYAAMKPKSNLEPFQFERRAPGAQDIVIDILYCGLCHSDIHQVRDEWSKGHFPMVPGHEIVGRVSRVGAKVKKFKPGDNAGVGCFVDSCGQCENCKSGLEQFCREGAVFTYNSVEKDGKTQTYGGYSSQMVVKEDYALRIAPGVPLEKVAPLLCAGITTYSPLRYWKVQKGQKVGVIGLGGLGHMAVKLAASMGADVTLFSTSASKEADAKRLGAKSFVITKDPAALKKWANQFNFLIDTVSAPHDLNAYLEMLKTGGTMVIVGVPPESTEIHAFSLIMGRRQLAGSMIGGIAETQEMLDYCLERKIFSDVEVIPMKDINGAYERMIKGDVRYRFVADLKTL